MANNPVNLNNTYTVVAATTAVTFAVAQPNNPAPAGLIVCQNTAGLTLTLPPINDVLPSPPSTQQVVPGVGSAQQITIFNQAGNAITIATNSADSSLPATLTIASSANAKITIRSSAETSTWYQIA